MLACSRRFDEINVCKNQRYVPGLPQKNTAEKEKGNSHFQKMLSKHNSPDGVTVSLGVPIGVVGSAEAVLEVQITIYLRFSI